MQSVVKLDSAPYCQRTVAVEMKDCSVELNRESQMREWARSRSVRKPEHSTKVSCPDNVFVNRDVARLAPVVVIQGSRRKILVERVLDDNKDDDCKNKKKGNDCFDHQASSLICAETVDLAMGVPRQRAVEAATESNRRNEREE